ncbi:MAG TPA: RIO1 family regulatory kinase/ATPase [Oceanobacillus sp.]|nr:RIO1 family regulatory kinase/ATPase [Oceanobacillus sp.]
MNESYSDKYAIYEEKFNPLNYDRKARRTRKPKAKHTPKKSRWEVVDEIADIEGLEGGFQTTYQPGRFEEGWLLNSLRPFYDRALITDVLARIKGGKEANVYRCEAHPVLDVKLVAAKVYRPRMFRNLRNDKVYREGRAVLKENGKEAKKTDHRLMRAMNKKTDYGAQAAHTSWLMYEFTTLQKLHAAGAAVPQPYSAAENCILMGYCGDEDGAAPALSEVTLEADEAKALFNDVLHNVEIMLQHGVVHGDLSAYNILYWEGRITLIDFPQVISTQGNSRAWQIFQRDIVRVCEYFAAQGVESAPNDIARRLWRRYDGRTAKDQAADLSRLLEQE